MTAPRLELQGISKAFGPVRALDGAHLAVEPGEIHALLGENGAGKTTLVAIAAGWTRPDAGEVVLDGRPVRLGSARDGRRSGVALVPQHDLLVDAASVADNLALLDPAGRPFESRAARRRRVERVGAELGLDLGSPDTRAASLPVGARQRVEIAGALLTDPAVLFLDEPTAVLAPAEARALFAALRARADRGRAVVLITHRLPEVFEAADRLTLLSRGRTVLESAVREVTAAEVAARLIGGAEAVARPALLPPAAPSAVPSLRVSAFRPRVVAAPTIDLEVGAFALNVFLAIDGNGADAIAAAVAGLAPAEGRIAVAGREVPPGRPRAFREAGGAYVPADRRSEGLLLDFTLAENLFLREARGPFLDRRALEARTAERLARFGVRSGGPRARARELSGGNQQKLLLARELEPLPRLLVAVHPTRGLDLSASADVRQRLLDAAAAGAGVLVVTSDPDEALAFGAPIRVVYRGTPSPLLPPDTPFETLGRLMAGLPA